MSNTKVFSAHKVYTMNPSRPEVSHVAVREGKILGAGSLDELTGWGEFDLDNRFKNKIIMPGFVEGHAHAMEGTLWRNVYVGWFDRMDPNGRLWQGAKSLDNVLQRLSEANMQLSDDTKPLSGWSLDP